MRGRIAAMYGIALLLPGAAAMSNEPTPTAPPDRTLIAVEIAAMPAELEPIRAHAAARSWTILCEGKSGEETVVRFGLPPGTDFPTLFRYFGDPAHPRGSSRNYFRAGQPLPRRCDEPAPIVVALKARGAARIDSHLLAAGPPARITRLVETAVACGFTRAASRAPVDSDARPRPVAWQADWLVLDASERTSARPGPLTCFRHLSADGADDPAPPAGAPTMPLAPVGGWISDHGDDLCAVQRREVGPDGAHDLALRQHVGQHSLEVVLTRADTAPSAPARSGFGKITLLPSNRVFEGISTSAVIDDHTRAADISVEETALASVADADGIVIDPGFGPVGWVSLNQMPAALELLHACRDEVLRGWGVDPARFRPVARPGEPGFQDLASYIRSSDYPVDARRAFQQGRVVVLMEIAPEGNVSACRIVESSEVASLDAKTCQIARERFRFAKWEDASGKPTISWATAAVRWIL